MTWLFQEDKPEEKTTTEPEAEVKEEPEKTEEASEKVEEEVEKEDVAVDEEEGVKEEKKPRKGTKPNRSFRSNRAVFHQSDNSDPSCRVYVGNLAWEVTWKELKDHMKQGGCEVTRADILASPDGRSKGCGIVEFESAEGAQRALLMNDTELMGRQIFVREDRETGKGGGYYTQKPVSGTGGGRVSGEEKQTCRVYVGNLSWDVAWQDLKDHMRSAGNVVHAEVMTDASGRSKGCGIVEFSTPEEAKEACSTLSDSDLKGRMIFVREDRETTASAGGHGGRGQRGGTSVYVGNLSYETSWQGKMMKIECTNAKK